MTEGDLRLVDLSRLGGGRPMIAVADVESRARNEPPEDESNSEDFLQTNVDCCNQLVEPRVVRWHVPRHARWRFGGKIVRDDVDVV